MSGLNVVIMSALTDSFTGYGVAAGGLIEVAKDLEKKGVISSLTLVDNALISFSYEGQHDIAIVIANPWTLVSQPRYREATMNALRGSRVKLLSVVWETDPLPSGWVPMLRDEKLFTGFITPSHFVEGLLKACVGDKPVHYVPHYVEVDHFPLSDPKKRAGEDTFTVLYVGQNTKRKGFIDAVVGFARAVGDKKDARLIVKYHRISDREIDPELEVFHASVTNLPGPGGGIYTMSENIPREKIYQLYQSSSLLLFPTRGEGFGLPPAEAMAAGTPVVYTNWSATPEVANAPGNLPIEYVLDDAHSMLHHGYEIGARYAVPLMTSIIEAIRAKYTLWKNDRTKYYDEVAGNRNLIRERFGREIVTRYLEECVTSGRVPVSV